MKLVLIRLGVGLTLLVIGFVSGRFFQDAKNGYHYTVLEQKQFESPMGPVHWTVASETVGLPFLDTEKTIIEFEGRTIYKARRDFHESVPVAQNITTSDKGIDWDDGELRFHLTIEEIKKGYRRLGSEWVKKN